MGKVHVEVVLGCESNLLEDTIGFGIAFQKKRSMAAGLDSTYQRINILRR